MSQQESVSAGECLSRSESHQLHMHAKRLSADTRAPPAREQVAKRFATAAPGEALLDALRARARQASGPPANSATAPSTPAHPPRPPNGSCRSLARAAPLEPAGTAGPG